MLNLQRFLIRLESSVSFKLTLGIQNNLTFFVNIVSNDGKSKPKSYYIAPKIKLSWAESLSFCEHFKMALVSFQSVEEEENLISLLRKYKNFQYNFVYIGGTKLGKDYWYWLKTGIKINLEGKWFWNEPNNDRGNENCLAISKRIDTGAVGFNDADCYGNDNMFVCESVKNYQIDLRVSA